MRRHGPLGARQDEQDPTGKVALITGASRGIGKRTALALARRGAKVVVTAPSATPNDVLAGTLGETVAEVESLGAEALAVAADLSREDDLERIVESAVDRFGGIDVNLHAPFTLVQSVVPIMEKRGGGRILNVTTGSGKVFRYPEEPPALEAMGDFSLGSPAYFASKRALDRFANVIAAPLARRNIAIITMHPGFVASEVTVHRVAGMGVDESIMVPPETPALMLAYFAACVDPFRYAGRIFWAERELEQFGIELDSR